jgi:hypothetical protein
MNDEQTIRELPELSKWAADLLSPTPGCQCDTCRAIRVAQKKILNAKVLI